VQDAGVGDTAADVRGSRDADGSSHISDAGSQDAPPDVTPDLTVEADAESPVTVSICPQTTTLLTGESMAFRAAVTGTTELTVDWTVLGDAGDRGVMTEPGLYIAPSTPGRYQVRAASRADPSKGDVATVTVIARTAVPTISGTVQYVGSPKGRIYVTIVEDDQGGTTTLSGPGPFTIRGIFGAPRPIKLRAYVDVPGVGQYVAAADPADEQTVSWTGAAVTDVRFALSEPRADPFAVPDDVTVHGYDGGALVRWKPLRDADGRELVDHYRVYASPHTNPGGDPAAVVANVRAGALPMAFVEGLANATSYYFAVTGVRDGTEGADAVTGPVVIGATSSGVDVSGTVSIPGWLFRATGRPYVMLANETTAYVARFDPTGAKPFRIRGVAPGTYAIGAALDRDANGELGPNDPVTVANPLHRTITVASAPVAGVAIELPSSASIRAMTEHRVDRDGSSYATEIELANTGNRQRVVKAALTSGPGISPPIDLKMDESGRFRWRVDQGSLLPNSEAFYELDVAYDDGSTCNATVRVAMSQYLAAPTPTEPVGPDAGSGQPTFRWDAPNPAPSWFAYSLAVRAPGGSEIWHYQLPSALTQVIFNADETALVGTLFAGAGYSWTISIYDTNGNRASHETSFTVP